MLHTTLARAALAALLYLATSVALPTARAQVPPLAPQAAAPPKPEATAEQRRGELERLVATLEDPAAREALLNQLRTLMRAEPPPAPADPLVGVVDQLEAQASARLNMVTESMGHLVNSISAVPQLVGWLGQQLADPVYRGVWYSVLTQAGLAATLGFIASLLTRRALRGWRGRLSDLPPSPPYRAKLAASGAHLTVDLAALATFLLITFAALQVLDVTWLARRVATDVLMAVGLGRGASALVKAVLATRNPRQRLLPVDDGEARPIRRKMTTIIGLSTYGAFTLISAQRLGMPWTVYGFSMRVLFAVVAGLIILLIFRLAPLIARGIEQWGASTHSDVARYLPWQLVARTGHWVLTAYVVALYLNWAVDVPGGTLILTRGAVVTLLVIAALRMIRVAMDARSRRQPATEEEALAAEAEGVSEEPAAAPSMVMAVVRMLLLAVGALLIVEAWGANLVDWLRSDSGNVVLESLVRLGLVLAIALALGQAIDFAAKRYLSARDPGGNLLYSNRSRTLASILRNIALVALAFIATINVLAQVGVDATALLAGAGVVGLAIGFGSQRLVQDLITGLFILLGDTIRVGDVVDLGGRSGVVEAMSMRTIALRAYDGGVHTVPYSSIDVVTNMTKDFSFCVIEAAVGYREDVDKVMEVLSDLSAQLRREWPYRRLILEPIDMAGVDRFGESAVVVKARLKTRPGEQWRVGFEFRRRMKRRFDELGIEIPFAHRALVFAGEGAEVDALARRREEVLSREARAARSA